MRDEIKKIMDFFSMSDEEKSEAMGDVFQDAIGFFQKFQYVLQNGTPEEKEAILKEVVEMQKQLKIETENICNETQMSEDELKSFAENPENFSDDEWEVIKKAQDELAKQTEQIDRMAAGKSPTLKKKAKDKKKSKKWMKS